MGQLASKGKSEIVAQSHLCRAVTNGEDFPVSKMLFWSGYPFFK
jgi:hypothetical protein